MGCSLKVEDGEIERKSENKNKRKKKILVFYIKIPHYVHPPSSNLSILSFKIQEMKYLKGWKKEETKS